MPSPFGHVLFSLTPSLSRQSPFAELPFKRRLGLVLWAACLAMGPDLDLLASFVYPERWLEFHRHCGHNVFSALALSLVGGLVIDWMCPKLGLLRSWLWSLLFVTSHLFLDACSYQYPGGQLEGVPLFWPFSPESFSIPLRLFPSIEMAPSRYPVIGHALSPHFWKHVVFQELLYVGGISLLWALSLTAFQPKRRIGWAKTHRPTT